MGIVCDKTVTHCNTLQHTATHCNRLAGGVFVWDKNQHNYTVERHNNISIVLDTHNTLTFSRNISDSGEVTSGPTRHLPGPGTILVGGTETHLGDTGMRH